MSIDFPKMKTYLGVKMLEAGPMSLGEYNKFRGWKIPDNENPETEGYLVKYADGYVSWSPRDAFESAYLALENPTKITPTEVEAFLLPAEASKIDEKTTLVKMNTVTGFVQYETSSCVDPENYNHAVGIEVASNSIKERIWPMLGFVLQWGMCGLKGKQ